MNEIVEVKINPQLQKPDSSVHSQLKQWLVHRTGIPQEAARRKHRQVRNDRSPGRKYRRNSQNHHGSERVIIHSNCTIQISLDILANLFCMETSFIVSWNLVGFHWRTNISENLV